MKHWSRFILSISLATVFCCVASPFGGVAFCASPPVVTVLPVIKEGSVTPTRIAQQPGTGHIFITDPHSEGVTVYDKVGKLLRKIITAKEPGGIAFAMNGDLLVTQGTYVAVIDPATGVENVAKRFGNFKSAFAIAVDNVNTVAPAPARTATGMIFVSDISASYVLYFNADYTPHAVSGDAHNPLSKPAPPYPANAIGDSYVNNSSTLGAAIFNRPAGVAFERTSGYLAVVDSLGGDIQFFDLNGNYITQVGEFGYAFGPNHPVLPMFTYPQSVAFEYTNEVLDRAYVLDTFQSYVFVFDASVPLPSWGWLSDIGQYGHANGQLIVPSDIFVDKADPANNRLLVTNGFGSTSVFGLASLQPYNVSISSVTSSTMQLNWSNASSSYPYNRVRVYASTVAGVTGTQIGGDLPAGTTTLPVTGLAPYTTYYFTVRAVYGASALSNSETPNIDQVSAKTTGTFNLSINKSGNGSGSVNSTPACTGNPCPQPADQEVTMSATASALSVFVGWTGDCFTTSETCIVTMDSAKTVTAFFEAARAFRVDGAYFDNLQDAYDAARDGAVIQVLASPAGTSWPSTASTTEYNTAWQAKTVTIAGGYDATFTTNSGGMSVVSGRTNVFKGKVIMKQFKLK